MKNLDTSTLKYLKKYNVHDKNHNLSVLGSKKNTPAKVTMILRVTLAGKKISLKVTILLRVTFSVLIHIHRV